jgi:hypothetical protein
MNLRILFRIEGFVLFYSFRWASAPVRALSVQARIGGSTIPTNDRSLLSRIGQLYRAGEKKSNGNQS